MNKQISQTLREQAFDKSRISNTIPSTNTSFTTNNQPTEESSAKPAEIEFLNSSTANSSNSNKQDSQATPTSEPPVTLSAIKSLFRDEIRAEIRPIQSSMESMKKDIHDIKQSTVTKQELADNLIPIQHEIDDLKKRINGIQISGDRDSDFMSKDQIQMINAIDPALRQLAFKGFKDMTESTRVAYIDSLLHDFNIPYSFVDHIYTGPRDNRKLSVVSLVEFPTIKAAENALSKLGGKNKELPISDKVTVVLKPAISKINLRRNSSLRKAHDLIKSSPQSHHKEVKLEFKERQVTVNGQPAFTQSNSQLKGTFLEPFTSLQLP